MATVKGLNLYVLRMDEMRLYRAKLYCLARLIEPTDIGYSIGRMLIRLYAHLRLDIDRAKSYIRLLDRAITGGFFRLLVDNGYTGEHRVAISNAQTYYGSEGYRRYIRSITPPSTDSSSYDEIYKRAPDLDTAIGDVIMLGYPNESMPDWWVRALA